MLEQMKWEKVYELWKYGCCDFSDLISAPVIVDNVHVEYNNSDYYFYGYDWLSNKEAIDRKETISKNPSQFLYFTKPTNKGTIQTAEMLVEARNEEELAAIWIAANAKEFSEYSSENDLRSYSSMLYDAAYEFLRKRFYLWHHAMKKLVPDIMIPYAVRNNIVCKDAEPVMGLIKMNTVLLKNTYTILRYSSLKDGTQPESRCRIE